MALRERVRLKSGANGTLAGDRAERGAQGAAISKSPARTRAKRPILRGRGAPAVSPVVWLLRSKGRVGDSEIAAPCAPAPLHSTRRPFCTTSDFYHCFRVGELEQMRDFIRWTGCYEAKVERRARYRDRACEHLRELRLQSGLGALALTPPGA